MARAQNAAVNLQDFECFSQRDPVANRCGPQFNLKKCTRLVSEPPQHMPRPPWWRTRCISRLACHSDRTGFPLVPT